MTASASQLTLHPKQNFISAILAILSFFWEWYLIFLLRFGILLLVTLVTHCGTTRMYYAKSECLVLLWCFHTAKSCIRLVWNQHKHNIFSLPPKKAFCWGGVRVPKQTDLLVSYTMKIAWCVVGLTLNSGTMLVCSYWLLLGGSRLSPAGVMKTWHPSFGFMVVSTTCPKLCPGTRLKLKFCRSLANKIRASICTRENKMLGCLYFQISNL